MKSKTIDKIFATLVLGSCAFFGFLGADFYLGKNVELNSAYKKEGIIEVDKKQYARVSRMIGIPFVYKNDLTIKYNFKDNSSDKVPCEITAYSDSFESGYWQVCHAKYEFTPEKNKIKLTFRLGDADLLTIKTPKTKYQIKMD